MADSQPFGAEAFDGLVVVDDFDPLVVRHLLGELPDVRPAATVSGGVSHVLATEVVFAHDRDEQPISLAAGRGRELVDPGRVLLPGIRAFDRARRPPSTS